jgi:hypothetical protein
METVDEFLLLGVFVLVLLFVIVRYIEGMLIIKMASEEFFLLGTFFLIGITGVVRFIDSGKKTLE